MNRLLRLSALLVCVVIQSATAQEAGLDLRDRARELEKLEAQIESLVKEYKSRKRIVRGTKAGDLQPYVSSCLNRILAVVNADYPEEARGRLYGRVVLAFSIRASGEVSSIEVARSSGHKVLDEALVQAVRKLSPFQPIPKEHELDLLEVVESFEFAPGNGH